MCCSSIHSAKPPRPHSCCVTCAGPRALPPRRAVPCRAAGAGWSRAGVLGAPQRCQQRAAAGFTALTLCIKRLKCSRKPPGSAWLSGAFAWVCQRAPERRFWGLIPSSCPHRGGAHTHVAAQGTHEAPSLCEAVLNFQYVLKNVHQSLFMILAPIKATEYCIECLSPFPLTALGSISVRI